MNYPYISRGHIENDLRELAQEWLDKIGIRDAKEVPEGSDLSDAYEIIEQLLDMLDA